MAGATPLTLDRAEAAIAVQGPEQPAGWKTVSLPDDWENSFPGHTGYDWYRARFDTPAREGLLGVYLQRACTNAEVYLNGILIARLPGHTTGYTLYPLTPQAVGAFKYGGKNTLAVHVKQTTGGQYIDVGFVDIMEPRAL